MTPFDELLRCTGHDWIGVNILQDPVTEQPVESPGTARVSLASQGAFIRFDYTWAYQAEPQEGSFLIGYDAEDDLVSLYWTDTWHMSRKGMTCVGIMGDGSMIVRGSYGPGAPSLTDGDSEVLQVWGWRIDITPRDASTVEVVMYNVDPDGAEELAVTTKYRREGA